MFILNYWNFIMNLSNLYLACVNFFKCIIRSMHQTSWELDFLSKLTFDMLNNRIVFWFVMQEQNIYLIKK